MSGAPLLIEHKPYCCCTNPRFMEFYTGEPSPHVWGWMEKKWFKCRRCDKPRQRPKEKTGQNLEKDS